MYLKYRKEDKTDMDNFRQDYERFTTDTYKWYKAIIRLIKNYDLRLIWLMRKYQEKKGFASL